MKPTREQVLHELLVNSDYAKMADAIMALYKENEALRAVVEAAKEHVRRHRSDLPQEYMFPNIEALEAALEKVKEGK